MEQRKIIKLGPSSYAITLPAQWIDRCNILDKKYVLLKEHNNLLIIQGEEEYNLKKEATVPFDDLSLKVFNKLLISYYLKNFFRIKIEGSQVDTQFEQVKLYIDKLPHLEIVSIEKNKIILEDSSRFSGLKIEEIFSTLEDMIKSMIKCLELSDPHETFIKMQILDKSINKTYFKAVKALNYHIYKQEDFSIVKNSVYYMKITTVYEKIGDNLKRISRYLKQYLKENELFPFGDISKGLEQILDLIISYRKSTASNKINVLAELNNKKMSILREIDERLETPGSSYYQLELVLFQLIKDILGSFDEIIIANVDAYGVE